MSKPDFASNASFALFANVFYLMTRLVLPPLILGYISLAEYGLWSACFVLIMYIGLTDVGFANVYVRFCAQYHAQGDVVAINRLLSTGIVTLSGLSVLVWLGLWSVLPLVLQLLNIPSTAQHDAQILILATSAMFLLDLTLGAFCYLLHGLQQIRAEKKIAICGYVLEPLLIWLFLHWGLGLFSLLFAFVLRYLWTLSAFIRLAYQLLPSLSIRLRYFDRSMLRHFFGFGVGVQLSTLLGTALFSLDRVLAGMLLGPKGIALFELGSKLAVSAIAVPATISNVALPAAADLAARQQHQALSQLYQKTTRSTAMLASLPLAFMAAFAPVICHAWLGDRPDYQMIPLILMLTCFWSQLHISTGPGSVIFRAQGNIQNEFVYHGLRIVALAITLSLTLSVLGTQLTHLAYALCIGNGVAASLYLIYNHRRISPDSSLLALLLPSLSVYPLAFIWAMLIPAHPNVLQLGFILMGYVVLWLALIWLQLNLDEKATLQRLIKPLRWRML